jgi:SAM-dependent methyltransferase
VNSDIFDTYSTYYDLFYRDKPYNAEVSSLLETIRSYKPDAQTLLDIGCGTGIHARLFQTAGLCVQGIDMSKRMIERAQVEATGNFQVGDARNYRLDTAVDVITLLFHVMSYQTNDADVCAVLATCYNNLVDDGLLLFDVWHGPAVRTQGPENRVRALEDDTVRVTRHATSSHDKARRVVEVHYDIEVQQLHKTNSAVSFSELHPMRYFEPAEMASFLTEAGFVLLEAKELLTDAPPSEETWGVLYVAQKSG